MVDIKIEYTPEELQKINDYDEQLSKDLQEASQKMREFLWKYGDAICGISVRKMKGYCWELLRIEVDGAQMRSQALNKDLKQDVGNTSKDVHES